ncbi:MAG: hypothetical protein ACREJ9_01720 [Candidatus Rokuibacteriota bacterium]
MTIAVAIRTLSAIVFAADSKLTTYGRVGYDKDGEAIVVPQTYDNATKIVADGNETGMAAVIGSATLGKISFMDFIASRTMPAIQDETVQEAELRTFVQGMGTLRTEYWSDVPEEKWPDTVLLLATSAGSSYNPTLWRAEFSGKKEPGLERIANRIYFEGSYRQVLSLLYGYDLHLVVAAASEIKIGEETLDSKLLTDAVGKSLKILKPIEQINPHVMPIQDAMELAFFLATTQVQMERFLPGEALCGAPIDVMVLKTAPVQEIVWHPGKSFITPRRGRLGEDR